MNKKLAILFSSLALWASPLIALAADPGAWFLGIIERFLNIVVWPVFFGLSIIMFIFAGFMFLTSAGDPSKISTAKKAVIFAVIGIAVAILAFSAQGIITNIIVERTSTGTILVPNGGACTNNANCVSGVCDGGICSGV